MQINTFVENMNDLRSQKFFPDIKKFKTKLNNTNSKTNSNSCTGSNRLIIEKYEIQIYKIKYEKLFQKKNWNKNHTNNNNSGEKHYHNKEPTRTHGLQHRER